jgi:hypothetical protein
MTCRLLLWTVGVALVWPGALAGAQPSEALQPEPSRRLRLELPAPPPLPVDAPATTSSGGLRTFATCPTCPSDSERPPVSADKAPWRIGAFYTVGNAFDHVTFGVVGQRNERLPLFMTVPIGTAIGPAPPPSAANATFDTRTRWLATIAAEKTLHNSRGDGGLGILGEVFLPLGSGSSTPAPDDRPSASGRAVRGGLRVPF